MKWLNMFCVNISLTTNVLEHIHVRRVCSESATPPLSDSFCQLLIHFSNVNTLACRSRASKNMLSRMSFPSLKTQQPPLKKTKAFRGILTFCKFRISDCQVLVLFIYSSNYKMLTDEKQMVNHKRNL